MIKFLRILATLVVLLAPAWAHDIALSWKQSTDPIALNCVFRAAVSGAEDPKNPLFCSTSPIITYDDLAVAAGDTWFYTVDAVNSKGVASPMSNETTSVVPLLSPTGLSSTPH